MNGRYLLDTTIVIVSLSGEPGVVDRIVDLDVCLWEPGSTAKRIV